MVDRVGVLWRFGRRIVRTGPGATVLDGLLRRGLPILQRSIRYHRPRAPFCGVGDCTQCLVRVNGVPNVRACRYIPEAGDRIETENAWPTVRHDLLGVLDRIFPRGVDTLHGFRRPTWALPIYHRVVRRLAGYGRAPTPVPARLIPPGRRISTRYLVLGAGPSGRRAAERLGRSGDPVHLLDREPVPDPPKGVIPLSAHEAFFLPPPVSGTRPFTLSARAPDGAGVTISAEKVVMAVGAYDTGLWFPGSDRPGVMTAEAAWRFSGASDHPPFRHAVVFGGKGRAGMMLERFGTQVEAVVAPGPVDPEVARHASDLGIPLYPRTLILGVRGGNRVKRVALAARGSNHRFSVNCDAVLVAHRRYPNAQMLFQAGARMRWHGSGAAYFPVLETSAETSVSGLYAAGEVAGFPDGTSAEGSGIAAAEAALGHEAPISRVPGRLTESGPSEMEGYYRELFRLVPSAEKWVVCPCEDVLLSEVRDAHERGFMGIEVVKRYTGIGTGLCQGRFCLPEGLLSLSIFEGRPPSEVGYITQRPPVRPVPLHTIAGLELADPAGGGVA